MAGMYKEKGWKLLIRGRREQPVYRKKYDADAAAEDLRQRGLSVDVVRV